MNHPDPDNFLTITEALRKIMLYLMKKDGYYQNYVAMFFDKVKNEWYNNNYGIALKRQHQYLLIAITLIAILSINFLVYRYFYSTFIKYPIYTTLSREKHIEKPEDAEQVFNAMIEENGTIIVEKNGYRILNRGSETHPIWFIKWWEWDTYCEEITYPDRAVAFFIWDFEFFGFLIFIFCVSRKKRHTEKSVSINS